jgi:NAD-dependent aldehyde dehydrogenases
MKIAQEEVFGPVLSVIRFSDDEEAYHIANDALWAGRRGVDHRHGVIPITW